MNFWQKNRLLSRVYEQRDKFRYVIKVFREKQCYTRSFIMCN